MIAVALMLYILGVAVTVLLIEATGHDCSPIKYFSVVTFWPLFIMWAYLNTIYQYMKCKWNNRNASHF